MIPQKSEYVRESTPLIFYFSPLVVAANEVVLRSAVVASAVAVAVASPLVRSRDPRDRAESDLKKLTSVQC